MIKWINSAEELPPEDGSYLCTNDPVYAFDAVYARYDGYGFKYGETYRNAKYWSIYTPLEKKYGKQS